MACKLRQTRRYITPLSTPGGHALQRCSRQQCLKGGYLHDDSGYVDGHEGVGRHEDVEQPGDVVQLLQAVGEPGDEPAEGEEGGDAALLNVRP